MKEIDLEITLRQAFVAGYDFSILKKDGGKGIDFDAWYKETLTRDTQG